MSKEIIDKSKYEPIHISNFLLDVLKYYGEKKNIKKNEDFLCLTLVEIWVYIQHF